jgi:hypothetical protein
MLKKAVHGGLLLAFLMTVACPAGHAVNLMKDVKKVENSVSKSVGKVGSGIHKSAKRTGKMAKKGTHKLKIHKPKL